MRAVRAILARLGDAAMRRALSLALALLAIGCADKTAIVVEVRSYSLIWGSTTDDSET